MDADTSRSKRHGPAPGGTVEPANRATIAKEIFQTPTEVPAERYELRDPFADVTYRSNSILEIVEKAHQLGSNRFVAVGADGAIPVFYLKRPGLDFRERVTLDQKARYVGGGSGSASPAGNNAR